MVAGGSTGTSTGGSSGTGGVTTGGVTAGGTSGGGSRTGGTTGAGGSSATGGTSGPTIIAATPPMGWNSWNTFGCDNLGRGFSLELEGGISVTLLERRFFASAPDNVVAETPGFSPTVGVALTYAR
jgi:hypothetical protein